MEEAEELIEIEKLENILIALELRAKNNEELKPDIKKFLQGYEDLVNDLEILNESVSEKIDELNKMLSKMKEFHENFTFRMHEMAEDLAAEGIDDSLLPTELFNTLHFAYVKEPSVDDIDELEKAAQNEEEKADEERFLTGGDEEEVREDDNQCEGDFLDDKNQD